jgi:hypothetical protein
MKRILATAVALGFGVSASAFAADPVMQTQFKLTPNPAFLTCLVSNGMPPTATVKVMRGNLNDTAMIQLSGFRPNLDFDVFTVQRSSLDSDGKPVAGFKGFGLAWYQSDLETDGDGNATAVIRTILLDQIFGFDSDAVAANGTTPASTVLKPTNTFHLGVWFNNPNDAQPCGFDVSKPTPFNGEHQAGPLALISTPIQPQNLGPLCTSPTSVSGPDDSGSDPAHPNVFACNP